VGFRITAERAQWSVRERAWDVEDRLAEAVEFAWPLQRLVETRVAWPVADAWRKGGNVTRTAMATGAVVAVAGAASAGMIAGAGGGSAEGEPASVARTGSTPAELVSAAGPVLKGIAPQFEGGSGETPAASPESGAPAKGAPVDPKVPPPDAPPADVARSFADAFVAYEVGEADERTSAVFAAVAEEPLARALQDEPPRLPAAAEVPKADVLNVVVGRRDGEKMEASVSLVRLDAASELRLTLEQTPEGWQVTRVLG
jgi:hypothetical protein